MNRIPASCLCLALALGLLGGCARAPVASNPVSAPASDETTPQPAPPQPAEPAVADTACVAPRTKMCTTQYDPVCATRDTGIRCITTPCPSSERKTFSSACAACVDPSVSGWTKGACPGG